MLRILSLYPVGCGTPLKVIKWGVTYMLYVAET